VGFVFLGLGLLLVGGGVFLGGVVGGVLCGLVVLWLGWFLVGVLGGGVGLGFFGGGGVGWFWVVGVLWWGVLGGGFGLVFFWGGGGLGVVGWGGGFWLVLFFGGVFGFGVVFFGLGGCFCGWFLLLCVVGVGWGGGFFSLLGGGLWGLGFVNKKSKGGKVHRASEGASRKGEKKNNLGRDRIKPGLETWETPGVVWEKGPQNTYLVGIGDCQINSKVKEAERKRNQP